MISASLRPLLTAAETCRATFFEAHSVPGRVSQVRLRRFPAVAFARDPTTIFVYLAFATAGMTYFLGVRTGFDLRDILLPSACKTTHALE
jgi:hypothetical protein